MGGPPGGKENPDSGLDKGKDGLGDVAETPARELAGPPSPEALREAELAVEKREADENRGELGEEVLNPEEVLEEDADKILDSKDLEAKLLRLEKEIEGIDALKTPEEKEEFVTKNRQRIIGLKFLLMYVRQKALVQDRDGVEVWVSESGELDLTDVEERMTKAEDALKEIVEEGETEEEDREFYEDLERTRDKISVKEFKELPVEKRLALVTNLRSMDLLREDFLLVVDFGANRKLERHIGLGDLMPSSIRAMSLGGRVYERKGNQGFYDQGKYLAIFTGSQVKVVKEDKEYSVEAEYATKYESAYVEDPKVVQAGGLDAKIESTEVTYGELDSVAKEFLVDAHFLQAVLEKKQYDPDTAARGNYDFVHMAARYIQNAEAKYEQLFGSAMHDSGKYYSEKFIAYAMDRFTLFNDYKPEQEATILSVMRRYSELRGVTLSESILSERRAEVNPRTNDEFRRRSADKGFSGSIEFEMPHGGKGVEMFNTDAWIDALKSSLREQGKSEEVINMTVLYASKVYGNMQNRMGSMYNSMVTINSYDGSDWRIKNSCVGGAMSMVQQLPLRVMRGQQEGRKFASNYYWGGYVAERRAFRSQGYEGNGFYWIRSLVSDDSHLNVEKGLTPANVDDKVGQHLAVGEPAAAGLWNHAIWLYKRPDGTVMIVHSGADVRPRKIAVSSVEEAPAGYTQRGDYYIRQRGSKVNELPFREFLARKQNTYGGSRGFVKFVTMSSIVESNLQYAEGRADFVDYYQRNA